MVETDRLVLRNWIESDIDPFIRLNQDAQVMRYFPGLYASNETRDMIKFCQGAIEGRGWGFWAVELKSSQKFIGMVGLNSIPEDIPLDDDMEVGWRLAAPYWGHGYASEAATASLNYAFTTLDTETVVAFTTVSNTPSRRVMERLDMYEREEHFQYPGLAADHPLAEHVVYQITKSQFQNRSQTF